MQPPLPFEENRFLSSLSTFQIGGPARWFVEADSVEKMQQLLSYCAAVKLSYLVIGKGSNCLFDDRGFAGLVILNKIDFLRWEGSCVVAGSGRSFSYLGTQTARKGFAGLEFASGIPGSVGGAVYMNAGASGAETGDVLDSVQFVNEKGELEVWPKDLLCFSYRFSSFQKRRGAIVSATFRLTPSLAARNKQLALTEYRLRTQPYQDPSIGCVFRNPQPLVAGALIEELGLKGTRFGGAEVSCLHGNFIVNRGGATATEVRALAEHVKRVVKEKKGIELELEMRCMPYEVEVE